MRLPYKYRLVLLVFILFIYFSGAYIITYHFTDKVWSYIFGFWLGVLCHIVEISIRNKFTQMEQSKLKYYPPKSY